MDDSSMGNPSPAQIEALLGPEWYEGIDWKNEAQAEEAYRVHVVPLLRRLGRAN